jgi:hypothetical protein
MRTRVSTLLLVLVLALPACSLVHDPNNASEGIRTEYLRQHWLHSYEEDQESDRVQIYRPIDFKEFPPSRFRMQYVFRRNGDCEWFYLAPDDGHHFRAGIWRLDPQDETVLHVEQGEQTASYRIIKLKKNLLRIEPLRRE